MLPDRLAGDLALKNGALSGLLEQRAVDGWTPTLLTRNLSERPGGWGWAKHGGAVLAYLQSLGPPQLTPQPGRGRRCGSCGRFADASHTCQTKGDDHVGAAAAKATIRTTVPGR